MQDNLQKQFYTANRAKLRKLLSTNKQYEGLMILAGSSFIQVSADRSYPFEQNANFLYLTGIEEPGMILVFDSDDEYLIVPERSESRIAFEGTVDTKKLAKQSGIETVLNGDDGWSNLERRLKRAKQVATTTPKYSYIQSIDMFINPANQQLVDKLKGFKRTLKFTDVHSEIISLRMIKTAYEVKMIEQAIKQTHKLFNVIERKRIKATHEHDLLAEIAKVRIKQNLKDAYEPIIASGANAVTLHYVENNAPIDKKSLLLLDIGLKYNHYSADITRTISYAPTKRQRAVYDAVLAVQEYAFGLLGPGVDLKEYETQVTQYMGEKLRELGLIVSITKESVRKYYPHSTSHFLGIDVHDVADYTRKLEPGMVLTVEPGIYIPEEGIGIRIEDDVLITKTGIRNLSIKLPKNLASLTIKP